MIELISIEPNVVFKSPTRTATSEQIISRKIQASLREREQAKLLDAEIIHKLSVEAKLIRAGAREFCAENDKKWMANFEKCENEIYVQMCEACMKVRELKYRCSLKWCPCCNWRVSLKRRELMERMTQGIYDCKHVVLTQRNFTTALLPKIRQSRANLAKVRRQKFMHKMTGGCASLEFTNEKKGWHLHWHLIVQASFISSGDLARKWGKLVGQEYAIVKVMDVDEVSYLQEICKYIVKGSELASWTPEQILEFVTALDGTRCFGTFGKFRQLQKFARALIACEKPDAPNCECGNDSFIHARDESEARRIHGKVFA
jgi:Replication protein